MDEPRRVHLLSDTSGMSFRVEQVRADHPYAEVWVRKADIERLVVAARNASDTWRRHGGISMGQMDDIHAALAALDGEDGE